MKEQVQPVDGSHASLCATVQPYGALSLRSQGIPFSVTNGILAFVIRGRNTSTTANNKLGDLQIQIESSSGNGGYQISKALTLNNLLKQQASQDGTDATELLSRIENGQWVAIRCKLSSLVEGSIIAREYYDRITIGRCLQPAENDLCAAAAGVSINPSFCLDRLFILS